MGFTPRDVNEMSFWEFVACCDVFAPAEKAGGGIVREYTLAELQAMGLEG